MYINYLHGHQTRHANYRHWPNRCHFFICKYC